MVTISCCKKFHAFALAEQMERGQMLNEFYTTYAYQKNTWLRRFTSRKDLEKISPEKISTNFSLAILLKLFESKSFLLNNLFDQWVSTEIIGDNSKIFIGWSGMSLKSILAAKKKNMITILERGSSHIQFQDELLRQEYHLIGKKFFINPDLIKKELAEYTACDFISIPSDFVRRTFLQFGIDENKLFINPYGAGKMFSNSTIKRRQNDKFSILYLGTLSVRKGLIYLFEALSRFEIPKEEYVVHFIGGIDKDFTNEVNKWKSSNWIFHGHVNHYSLPEMLENMDVAVQPSVEEGLSVVIPQIMSCGIPVIATTNTGGEDIIEQGISGIIVPIRSPESICEAITRLYSDEVGRKRMGIAAQNAVQDRFTWDAYGDRYLKFIRKIL